MFCICNCLVCKKDRVVCVKILHYTLFSALSPYLLKGKYMGGCGGCFVLVFGFLIYFLFCNFMSFKFSCMYYCRTSASGSDSVVTLSCNQRLLLVLMCINYQYVLQDLEISFADFLEAASLPPCPVLGHLTACAPRLWEGFHD